MARGNLVIKGGPGWFSRFLRGAVTPVLIVGGLVVAGAAGGWLAAVRIERALGEVPVAAILARDVGILTGAIIAIAVGLVLLSMQLLSGWIRRLQAAADRHERNEATANAAGSVLVRLAPHLAYEAELDERVQDLMQTVDVISGRSGTGMRRPLDLGLLIGECLDRRASAFASHDRELRRELQPDVWVAGEPDRLALAVDHAVRNAIEALGDQPGRVEVTMEASRHTVEVLIRDTGADVPRENRHRLFDTGYTTKEGRAGLGLALIRRVAVDHDGYVELRHPWGGGTTLRIVLPRVKKPSGGVVEPPPTPRPMVIPPDVPSEDPVLVMPPPPPPADDAVPPTIADDFSAIDADELLSRSGARVPSPPTAIRERTGAPKYLPGEEPEGEEPQLEMPPAAEPGADFMDAETMVLDPAEQDELSFAEESPEETVPEERAPEEEGPALEDEPAPEEPPDAGSIEQQAEDEMKDFFGA